MSSGDDELDGMHDLSQPEQVVRVLRPLAFDEALEAAKSAWHLNYGVALRTVLVRDSLDENALIERYEVTVFDRSPLVEGESDDSTWGPK
ncbi:hypothetical protein GCM10023084_05770 [Streptomyces lacrimifluminis]|uniref:Uncharacterized protein n=1 Tax=Streptomyces lacrimifluminis TaxID=1500077 RepID=A0A917KPA6_9ACTN|nr:hypothetical protein [Streptomyces lacrimifluminis]GGJ23092.1 hypothetical protein GCM10012282_19510 [Streptomyces lacrimifluminis]